MRTKRKKKSELHGPIRRTIGAGPVLLASLFCTIAVGVLPFKNILPYVHHMSEGERIVLALLVSVSIGLLACWSMTAKQRMEMQRGFLRTRSDVLGTLGGLLMFTYASAWLSPNTFGQLSKIFPSDQVKREFVVVEATRQGSKYRSTKLELKDASGTHHELVLSRAVFGDIPPIKSGDTLKVIAQENFVGLYVTHFAVAAK